jgi:hypothetical protein
MRPVAIALAFVFAIPAFAIPAYAATRSRHLSSLSHKGTARHAIHEKMQFQRTIDDDRAAQIQSALIQAGYLSGSPSGHWDAESEAAMVHLQGDNGWQTKLVPDSRALIKLGLGPASSGASSSFTPQ